MKRLLCVFPLLLFFTNSVLSTEVDSLLHVLKKELDNKDVYLKEKENRIKNLKELLTAKDLQPDYVYNINDKIHKEYTKYQIDSAIHYVEQNLIIANKLQNNRLVTESRLDLVPLYSTRGLYIEATDILETIDKDKLEKDLLIKYYNGYSLLYRHYAQSNSMYNLYAQSNLYKDSLIMTLDPNSIEYAIEYAQRELYRNNGFENSEKILFPIFDKLSLESPQYAMVAYLLGYANELKSETELQKKYYTLSAISDIKNVIKDNASFQSLALILYQEGKGDIDLAYSCNRNSLEDAIFCNVRYRTIESSNTYPIITGTYQQKENMQKKKLELFLVITSVLSVIVITALVYIYRQMKRVARIRKELYQANQRLNKLNENLNETNIRLEESNDIKVKYIAYSFDLCSNYIDKIEGLKNSLNKKIQTRRMDEVARILSSNELISKELKDFYHNFDNMFLGIYPTFIDDFNKLLISTDKIKVKHGELLSPELRIFALVRLGISDSNKIASYLHYSLSTIYNYRTKIKNKSAVPREEFEDWVMKIGRMSS